MMEEVYILSALRTPIGLRRGCFRRTRPENLGAAVLKALLVRHHLSKVDGVLGGNAVGTGGNLTRLSALTAGLDESIPACTVDMQCASGAASLALGFAQIRAGLWDSCLAGGMESASLQPMRTYHRLDERHSLTKNGAYYVAQFSPGEVSPDAMLRGAERVAQAEGISREELDSWALHSHQRAAEAQASGVFKDAIVPVNGCDRDEGIRPSISLRLLMRLPPLFGPGTATTAGNACRTNDGAAFALLVSGRWLKKHPENIPLARILDVASCGGNPLESPRGAMNTADLLLRRQGLGYEDLTDIEFNEAFAVIDVLFAREHDRLTDRYNRFGGALAYGHPYGASGGVLLIQLLCALGRKKHRKGLLSIAGAGGMGEAILIESC